MLRMRHLVLLTSVAATMGGCVSADKYNALRLERDQYLERLGQAEAEARAEREKARVLQQQLDAMLGAGGSQQGLLLNLQQQNAALKAQLEELNRRYDEAMRREPTVILPQSVSNDLQALASQNPDLLEFDASRGLLKFKSDVTFASGSADVQAKARSVLDQVARILNSPSVANYELLVAGHTDNVPVANPATIRAGHKDNWYLSAHRAITVGAELRKGGIGASRMGVVGYADQRPVASNASESGKAQNRRVEVLILPPAASSAAPATAAPSGAAAPALNK